MPESDWESDSEYDDEIVSKLPKHSKSMKNHKRVAEPTDEVDDSEDQPIKAAIKN